MICVAENVTKTTGFTRQQHNQPPPSKVCLCDEENGFAEDLEDNRCNGEWDYTLIGVIARSQQVWLHIEIVTVAVLAFVSRNID